MANWGYNYPYGSSGYKDNISFMAEPTTGIIDLAVFFYAPYYDPQSYNYYWYKDSSLGESSYSLADIKNTEYIAVYDVAGLYTARLTITTLLGATVFTEDVQISALPRGIYPYSTKKCFVCNTNLYAESNEKNYEQGIGFSEYNGYWPMPEAIIGGLTIIDEQDQKRYIVLDGEDGIFYDINTKDSASGFDIFRSNKDKEDISVAGGYDITPYVEFKEDTGEYEKFITEHLESRYYLRPLKEEYIDANGYDSGGFINGTIITATINVDNKPIEDVINAYNIPKNGTISYKRKVEGNRIYSCLGSNKGDIQIVGRHNSYITKDINYNNEVVSNESTYNLSLSTPMIWVTRGSNTDLVNGTVVDGSNTTGPDGYSNSAITINTPAELEIPTTTSIQIMSFWVKGNFSVEWKYNGSWYDASSGIYQLSTSSNLDNGWGFWIVQYNGNQGVKIIPTTSCDIFDVRVYDYYIDFTSYFNDIVYNGGNNVCPVF